MKYLIAIPFSLAALTLSGAVPALYPAPGAENVNIDTRLKITLPEPPVRGQSGMIRVFDTLTGAVVDSIDLSIPDGLSESRTYPDECHYTYTPYDYARTSVPTNRTTTPGTPSGEAEPTPLDHQLTIIGGFTDGFRFHPLLSRGNDAVITLHNNMLDYGRTYRVEVDSHVLANKGFKGVSSADNWHFSTKAAPTAASDTLRVNADGSADFSTLQGALDAVPDFSPTETVILVAPGDYEEIVYTRNKTNLTIIGAGMDCTRVHYANNEVFNPHPVLVKTNEFPGTFPSRRAAVMFDNCHDLILRDITFATDLFGQAEGLLLNGERIALYDVRIVGSGDALQANGTVYLEDCEIDGGGDTILGRGSVYLYRCKLKNDGGPFTWVRNTQGHHGDVFVECTFECPDGRMCDYGRCNANKGNTYPHAEIVLIDCGVRNLNPLGWSSLGEPTVRMLEYNTSDMATGGKADVSGRHEYSRQLDADADAATIRSYRNPAFVLKGWYPKKSRQADTASHTKWANTHTFLYKKYRTGMSARYFLYVRHRKISRGRCAGRP